MNLTDMQYCADYFTESYLKTFYLVTTYSGKSFILIGEKTNFPHLMGIPKSTYKSHGYNNPSRLYRDIINRYHIDTAIIPNIIAPTSKMYKKALNFKNSTDIFWKNKGPLAINYNPALSISRLNNVDILLTDIRTGYMLGWVHNSTVPINGMISLEKYCICTWIDESNGTVQSKEKYMPGQNVDLVRYIFAFDNHGKLTRRKEYKYTHMEKEQILLTCARNNSNLTINNVNTRFYTEIAIQKQIHCLINNTPY